MTDKIEVPRELLEELRDVAEDAGNMQIILGFQQSNVVWKDYLPILEQANALLEEPEQPSPDVSALVEALEDMLSGWKYIRESHGDLYGVGWDRAENKARAALAAHRNQGDGK